MKAYKVIDMQSDPRKKHFEYFNSMANPYTGVTVKVDVDAFVKHCKENRLSFFLSFLYCAGQAANEVPQLRRRIVENRVVEFESCDTSHTVMRDNETYSYCRLNTMQPFDEYIVQAARLQEEAKQQDTLDDGEDADSLLFVSCSPWLSHSSLVQPTPTPADSNPRITWGKYTSENGRLVIPVTLLANHALVDGLHIARFYAALEQKLTTFTQSTVYRPATDNNGIVTD